MKKVSFDVKLNNMDDVKDFINEICKHPFDAELRSGKYNVDAKSIMGVFSLDLSHPVELTISNASDKDVAAFKDAISEMIV